MQNGTHRVLALEGLRGIAAVAVVFFHILQNFYPHIVTGHDKPQHLFFEDNLYGFPLMALLSGPYAVAIFFVLSGFVLSIGFFSSKSETVIKKLAAKRYVRLMIPAAVSIMIAWLLIGANQNYVDEAIVIIKNTDLTYIWSFSADFWSALYQGTIGIFMGGEVTYNPVTWTMVYEFIGSMVVFAFCLLFGKSKRRWIMYILLILLTAQTWYLAFILGVLLADLYVHREHIFNNKPLGALMLIVGIFFGGYAIGSIDGTIYETLTVPGWMPGQSKQFFLTIGAVLLIAAVLSLAKLQKILSSKLLSSLGRYTYSLYLVHLPLLYAVAFGVFVYMVNNQGMGYNHAVAVALAVYIPTVILATWLFERYIDAPSIKLSSVFARLILSKDQDKT